MATNPQSKESIWLKFHQNFVMEDIPVRNSERSTNIITIPLGIELKPIDSDIPIDVGGFQFFANYVTKPTLFENNKPVRDSEGKLVRDETSKWRDVPLASDKPLTISKGLGEKDAEGNWIPQLDDKGNKLYASLQVNPQDLKEALVNDRKAYLEKRKTKSESRSQTKETRVSPQQDILFAKEAQTSSPHYAPPRHSQEK